ncbi:type II secretion system protein GspK [Zavarzinella formosa]|uniref:type II secretion system protein GspK n=1 Tax=Zavarzinella formosa TaxID=360055 RepID=UPI0002F00415|nr:type II secretion system protein GspK [Zavarzinella formosa]
MLLRTTITGQRTTNPRRGGFVIVAVLMVIAVLMLAAYQYSSLMDAEYLAADRMRKTNEARILADSGIHYACAMLADPDAFSGTLNSNPYDNPSVFQSVLVKESDNARAQGRFSLVSPNYADQSVLTSGMAPMRFGMIDEGSKLNINALYAADSTGQVLHDALMKLTNMTDEIAWCIVDWVDPNDTESTGGAESQYYSSLSPPYQCKNGPLDTIEELLLVKGVTPLLLYGTDINRNGKTDPGEDDSLGFTLGWSAFLTVYSRERNVDSTGAKRVNLNGNDLNTLMTDLTTAVGADLANFIIAYRIYGGTSSSSSGSGSGSGSGGSAPSPKGGGMGGGGGATQSRPGSPAQLQQSVNQAITAQTQPKQRISSLFSLMGASVTVTSQNRQQPSMSFASPLTNDGSSSDLLGTLLDKCTTSANAELPARVNVNTAPHDVLMALPGMTEQYVQSIINNRPTYLNGDAQDTTFNTVAWLISSGGMKSTDLQALERYITARTQVYRVISVGHFDEVGPIARIEAVIDVNQGKPRIVYYRDLTDQGRAVDPRTISQ